jgi:plasmid stabilization system protein ParE
VTLRFAPLAEADFATVIGYLAERNPVAAHEFGAASSPIYVRSGR